MVKNKPIRKNNRTLNIEIATGAKTPEIVDRPFGCAVEKSTDAKNTSRNNN